MEQISIPPTETTPKVVLDPASGRLEISGESRPENARKFYEPILAWFDRYKDFLQQQQKEQGAAYKKDLEMTFGFDYLNSTSIKFMYDLLKKLEEMKPHTTGLKINWLYEEGDDDMMESGEEYSQMLSVPFTIRQK